MRFAVAIGLAISVGACMEDSRTIEIDVPEVVVPAGAGTNVGVIVDGHPLSRTDAFSWDVDDPNVATASVTDDGAHVRITGRSEGATIVHLGYRTAVIDVPTQVTPAAMIMLAIEPSTVMTLIGSTVAVHATATYTTGEARDVTSLTAWQIDDAAIATVAGGTVLGVSTGQTLLHATTDGAQRVVVIDVQRP